MVAMGVAEGRNPGKQRANSSYTANWPGETPAVWRGGSGSQHCCIVTTQLQATKSPLPCSLPCPLTLDRSCSGSRSAWYCIMAGLRYLRPSLRACLRASNS